MNIKVYPGRLSGYISTPPSKSAAHRAVICAALAKGRSIISGISLTQDMEATIGAMNALGAACSYHEGTVAVEGVASIPAAARIDCNESGSTLRFVVPIATALGVPTIFTGRGKLPQRPMGPLATALEQHGVTVSRQNDEIITVRGKLQSGRYEIAGNVSSQYITGLLFALPLLKGDSEILITSPLESRGYVNMTLSALSLFGITVETMPSGFFVPGNQRYQCSNMAVEGDYSGAAFWLCAGALHSCINVTGLVSSSLQGDKEILPILRQMGAALHEKDATICVTPGFLEGITVDVSQIPDLAPILAVTGAFARGTTVLKNAARLRLKECDRLQAITAGLTAIGGRVTAHRDSLVIEGQPSLPGGAVVDSYDDHRIAMAMTIAALGCRQPVTITGAECVSKSYNLFYEDFRSLGGSFDVV